MVTVNENEDTVIEISQASQLEVSQIEVSQVSQVSGQVQYNLQVVKVD